MAVYACVLAKVRVGKTLALIQKLKALPNVGAAFAVAGTDDLVVIVRADDAAELGKIIVEQIQGDNPDISATRTLVVVGELELVNWMAEKD